jgi:transportin-3
VLIEAFEMVCDITFMHLPKLSSFEENPDLTEDFFGMLLRYGRYSPQLLLQSKSLGTILQLTEIGIGVKHHHAAKAIYGWIEVLCKMQSSTKHPDFHSSIPVE